MSIAMSADQRRRRARMHEVVHALAAWQCKSTSAPVELLHSSTIHLGKLFGGTLVPPSGLTSEIRGLYITPYLTDVFLQARSRRRTAEISKHISSSEDGACAEPPPPHSYSGPVRNLPIVVHRERSAPSSVPHAVFRRHRLDWLCLCC